MGKYGFSIYGFYPAMPSGKFLGKISPEDFRRDFVPEKTGWRAIYTTRAILAVDNTRFCHLCGGVYDADAHPHCTSPQKWKFKEISALVDMARMYGGALYGHSVILEYTTGVYRPKLKDFRRADVTARAVRISDFRAIVIGAEIAPNARGKRQDFFAAAAAAQEIGKIKNLSACHILHADVIAGA